MREQLEMEALPRSERGKNAARRLRKAGKVPAVLYGLGKDSMPLSLDTKSMRRLIYSRSGHNQIVNLKVQGSEEAAVLAVDWQTDPVRGDLLHVDMLRVDLTKPVEASVAIVPVGVSRGVKEQGGIEEMVNREIEIASLPLDVPERIEVDISELMLGQSIRVKDLPASDKYTYLTPPERVLVHVIAPRVAEEPVAVEEAEVAPTEPEVAEKGKAEETKEQPEKETKKE